MALAFSLIAACIRPFSACSEDRPSHARRSSSAFSQSTSKPARDASTRRSGPSANLYTSPVKLEYARVFRIICIKKKEQFMLQETKADPAKKGGKGLHDA